MNEDQSTKEMVFFGPTPYNSEVIIASTLTNILELLHFSSMTISAI